MNGLSLVIKALIIGGVVVGVSELAKKNPLTGAILASLPLTSIAAFIWMHHQNQDLQSIQTLSSGIFWMVIPSLSFFLIFPLLLKGGAGFYLSLLLSCVATSAVYFVFMRLFRWI